LLLSGPFLEETGLYDGWLFKTSGRYLKSGCPYKREAQLSPVRFDDEKPQITFSTAWIWTCYLRWFGFRLWPNSGIDCPPKI